jgi:hypothetical protein
MARTADTFDANKSKAQLVLELAAIRSQLTAGEQMNREQAQKLTRLKSLEAQHHGGYRAEVGACMQSLASGWRQWGITTKDGESGSAPGPRPGDTLSIQSALGQGGRLTLTLPFSSAVENSQTSPEAMLSESARELINRD